MLFGGASDDGTSADLWTLTNRGGRLFAGAAFAPARKKLESGREFVMRIELDAGLLYSAPTSEDDEPGFFPDLSLGINFNW